MAKTPRSSKATAKAKATPRKEPTRPAAAAKPAAKQAAAKKTPAAAKKSAAKKAPAAATIPTKGPAKPTVAEASAKAKTEAKIEKGSAKKAAAQSPAKKKAAKKIAAEQAPAAAQSPAKKKAAKKIAAPQAPAAAQTPTKKKAAKKPASAPASEQLALTMDIDPPATAAAPASPLKPGDAAPDFSLASDDGHTYTRGSLAGQRFVLYFYPKDDTPGCTRQACDFRDNQPRFDAASVKVFGVSSDSLRSHDRFRSKYGLNFPLLADPDRTLAQAFGAVGIKKMYGKASVGVIRSTFVVGPDGIIEKTFSPVKVDGHAAAVLQAIGAG